MVDLQAKGLEGGEARRIQLDATSRLIVRLDHLTVWLMAALASIFSIYPGIQALLIQDESRVTQEPRQSGVLPQP
jgi:hypothetical protein